MLSFNLIFHRDGQFVSSSEFTDCRDCSLGRGGSGQQSFADHGLVYDTTNNGLWCVSADTVHLFSSPGHRAPSHVAARLGLPAAAAKPEGSAASDGGGLEEGNMMRVAEVRRILLRHVGLLSAHAEENIKNPGISGTNH